MKIAVSSYSFSQAMRDGRMTIMDVIPKAKEMGYEGVEIVRGGWSDEEMRAMAPKLKAQSEEYGMPIIAYMVGADFIRNGLDAEVERLKREAEVAALLGAPRFHRRPRRERQPRDRGRGAADRGRGLSPRDGIRRGSGRTYDDRKPRLFLPGRLPREEAD